MASTAATSCKTALGTGFAAAALPVAAQTMIKTDTEGLTAGDSQPDGQRPERAGVPRPAGGQDQPAGDPGGVRNLRRARAHRRRCAPLRQAGLPGAGAATCSCARAIRRRTPTSPKLMKDIISKAPDAQVMGDLDAWWPGRSEERRQCRTSWASPAFAGAGASPGCTARTIPKRQGGRRLVRPPGRRQDRADSPQHPIDIAADTQGAGAGPVRRARTTAFRWTRSRR